MKKLLFIILLTVLPGCTISLSLVNSHGISKDAVDSEPTTETKADAQIEIPIKGI